MKVDIEVPKELIDSVVAEEMKQLRAKNNRLFSENDRLKSQINAFKLEQKNYDAARSLVVDLADIFEVGGDRY